MLLSSRLPLRIVHSHIQDQELSDQRESIIDESSHQDSAARGQSIPLVFFAMVPSPRIEMFTDPFRTIRVLTAGTCQTQLATRMKKSRSMFESWRYSVVSVSAAEVLSSLFRALLRASSKGDSVSVSLKLSEISIWNPSRASSITFFNSSPPAMLCVIEPRRFTIFDFFNTLSMSASAKPHSFMRRINSSRVVPS